MTGFPREVRALMRQRASVDVDGEFLFCEVQAQCKGHVMTRHEAHHRRPRQAGGSRRPETNQAANGLLICPDDHRFIESNREMAYRNGWLVRQNAEPATTPLLYRHRWSLLDNEGNVLPADCVCGETGPNGWVPQPCRCTEAD